MCEVVLFGAIERPHRKPGQLSLVMEGVSPLPRYPVPAVKEVPFPTLLCLKLKLGRLSLSEDALKDTAFSPAD